MNYNKYSIAWIYHYLSINLIAFCLCVSGVSSQLFQFIQAHFRCNLCAQTPRYDTLLHLNSKFKIKNDSPLGVKTNQKKKKCRTWVPSVLSFYGTTWRLVLCLKSKTVLQCEVTSRKLLFGEQFLFICEIFYWIWISSKLKFLLCLLVSKRKNKLRNNHYWSLHDY